VKCQHRWAATALFVGALAMSSFSNAALVSRLNGQAVYDTDFNITWLADANLAASNTFGVASINSDGSMNWNTAQSWIGAMNVANYLGFNNWRLPTSDTCEGHNCTGSEMGHLFYDELGGISGSDITFTHNANYSLFNNIQSNAYWSGTEYLLDVTQVWIFLFNDGDLNSDFKDFQYAAWAVRSGDVAAVPVPGAVWLFGSGLLGLIGVARRKVA
jgi:hypothetical protein